jgi:hypothetical protein
MAYTTQVVGAEAKSDAATHSITTVESILNKNKRKAAEAREKAVLVCEECFPRNSCRENVV